MPGDELVAGPSFNATRAITIGAPPAQVWPWIVQMGYRRAGFYTYALLDNAGYDSADEILPQYQHPQVGDWMPMAKNLTEETAFRVAAFETDSWLVVGQAGQHVGVDALAARRGQDPGFGTRGSDRRRRS